MKELKFNIYATDIEMEGEELRGVFNNYYTNKGDELITDSDMIFSLNKESAKVIDALWKHKSINEIIKILPNKDYFVYIENNNIILEWTCHSFDAYGRYEWEINKINFGIDSEL